jgi:rSAM/selenodomain-associated transferase 2
VIIPALDEQKALPATLESLLAQEGWSELWIVDGGSSDRTVAIARAYAEMDNRVKVIRGKRGRGSQMNTGARKARAEVLLFLHADTRLEANCLAMLHQQMEKGICAGCFTVAFSPADFSLRLLAWLHNWRFSMTRIAYGDQALFIRRDLFWQLGGFPEVRMEDIRFGERLRWSTRQRRLPARVLTDSRKFRQLGTWRAVFYVLQILLADTFGKLPRSRFFDNVR